MFACIHKSRSQKITEHCVLLQPCPSSLVCFIQPDTHTLNYLVINRNVNYKECRRKKTLQDRTQGLLWMEKKLFSHTIHKFASMHSQDNPSLQKEANTISCIVVILKLLNVGFWGNYILQSKTSKNNPMLRQIFFIGWTNCLCAVNTFECSSCL